MVLSGTVSLILTVGGSGGLRARLVADISTLPQISGWRGAFFRLTGQVDVLAVLCLSLDLTDGLRWSN